MAAAGTSGLKVANDVLPRWAHPVSAPPHAPVILIVDGSEINRILIRAMLKAAPYRVLEASRAADAMVLLENERVDLVILELMLPAMSGPEFCRWLKSNRKTQLIPVLMLTSLHSVHNEIEGIDSGADEFLIKPLHPSVVRTRIRALLRNKAAVDSLEEAETILFALAQAVEQRDKCTGGHCLRLASLSVALGHAMGLPQEQLLALHRGGYLHDIGKIGVPDAVLFKHGELDAAEWQIMRAHTTGGEQICRPMKSLAPVLPIIRNHHERWNGSGYPDGLRGEEIPLLARVLQVADIYDALTSVRPYKTALRHDDAIGILEEEARQGWRDPELVSLFRQVSSSPGLVEELPDWDQQGAMRQSLDAMSRELLK